ncbi:NAD-glutamate dehydrogenase [bacterium]|nr:NAD-glutamate dehydrogenase [bacterium]
MNTGMATQKNTSLFNLRYEEFQKVSKSSLAASPVSPYDDRSIFEVLFGRAPSDYLEATTTDTLERIAQEMAEQYNQFKTTDKRVLLSVETAKPGDPRAQHILIRLTLADRPFIVDSLLELFRALKLEVHCFHHPMILEKSDQYVSINYAEVSRIDLSIDQLEAQLQELLPELVQVTDDFPVMLRETNEAVRMLEGVSSPDWPELSEFLLWLTTSGMVLMGVLRASGGRLTRLGLFSENVKRVAFTKHCVAVAERARELKQSCIVLQSPSYSIVHKRQPIDVIIIPMQDGSVFAVAGTLTSHAISLEVSGIPSFKKKLQDLLKTEGAIPNAHDYKAIIAIVNTIPKIQLFQMTFNELKDHVELLLAREHREAVTVQLRTDASDTYTTIMIAMPRVRFTDRAPHVVKNYIEQITNIPRESSHVVLAITEEQFARMYVSFPYAQAQAQALDIQKIEAELGQLTQTWEESVLDAASKAKITDVPRLTIRRIAQLLPEQYRSAVTPIEAALDARVISTLSHSNAIRCEVRPTAQSEQLILTVYKLGKPLSLSSVIPVLEHVNLEVQSELATSSTKPEQFEFSMSRFVVNLRSTEQTEIEALRSIFIPGLEGILNGKAIDDSLNSLLINPGLHLSDIALVRAMLGYLWQIKIGTTREQLIAAVNRYPQIVKMIVAMFYQRFNPALDATERATRFAEILRSASELARSIKLAADDKIIKAMLNLIQSIVRTNFFRNDTCERIAFKIDCSKITTMPTPRPLYETYVNSPAVEAVHLRCSRVSRGGIRWSDRPEDFRTEVLGLVKTQMIKNTIIVPSGAKGGFIAKHPAGKAITSEHVVEAYKQFIRSLLELADNRCDGKVVHPEKTVIYDEVDPYLVVAADKGTATFSDTANELAVKEFNFWLGDAFASGGSNGYDHKKVGITARGTWESVKRHFTDLGRNVEKETYTMAGIGDMSGDVFGNGLILAKNAKLIAAFDHRHIFIDPSPDPAVSYSERKRLFELPKSSWNDYNKSLISTGGGVWSRADKEIQLSSQAMQVLATEQSSFTPMELMHVILKAPVDLIWNGGIGTYVKASIESHEAAGDRANDDCRVNGKQLRAKIFAEGGNLGATQIGRVEFARDVHGRINTDAVDNSGGVDLSDHEVNIKILLDTLVRQGTMQVPARNALLAKLTNEVAELVLERNRLQNIVISLGERRSQRNLDIYAAMIDRLAKVGVVDRVRDGFPDEEIITRYIKEKRGLTRPTLALLIGYAKLILSDQIVKTKLPDDIFLEKLLLDYFPAELVQTYPDAVKNHPLRREIITKQVVNITVELMGSAFVNRVAQETSLNDVDVVSAFLIGTAVADAREIWMQLRILDTAASVHEFSHAALSLSNSLDRMTRWFLEQRSDRGSLEPEIEHYRGRFRVLSSQINKILAPKELKLFQAFVAELENAGLARSVAEKVRSLSYGAMFLDIIDVADKTGHDLIEVAKVAFILSERFTIPEILSQATQLPVTNRWDMISLRSLTSELRQGITTITKSIISETGRTDAEAIEKYLQKRKETVNTFTANTTHMLNGSLQISSLHVICSHLRAIARKRQN